MDAGIKIHVIVLSSEFDPEKNNFARSLIKHKNGYLYRPSQEIPFMKGFVVIGDSAYRFRTKKEEPEYIANFNNKTFGKFLNDIFDDVLKNCKEVELLPG